MYCVFGQIKQIQPGRNRFLMMMRLHGNLPLNKSGDGFQSKANALPTSGFGCVQLCAGVTVPMFV
jgi:hypothetical protein